MVFTRVDQKIEPLIRENQIFKQKSDELSIKIQNNEIISRRVLELINETITGLDVVSKNKARPILLQLKHCKENTDPEKQKENKTCKTFLHAETSITVTMRNNDQHSLAKLQKHLYCYIEY